MHQGFSAAKKAASFFILAAASTVALAGSGTVPFTASIKTTEFNLPTTQCASGSGGIGAGVGTTNLFTKKPATDRTSVVLTSFDCVNPQSPVLINFSDGKFTLTGAGGDTIFASYSGNLVFRSADPATGVATFDFSGATFNIIGGTGRYARAAGAGTITGTEAINQATGTSQGNLFASGNIVY